MATLLQYKCPSCGGALEFDPNAQSVKCPYCDTEFEMEAIRALYEQQNTIAQEDMAWEAAPGSQWQEGEAEQLCAYVCQPCGGEIVADENTAATSCPYCGNPVVMTGRLSGALRPDLVIPFKLDKQAAEAALANHLKGKILLPKVFKDENRIKQIKGIYVPFWLFDADTDSDIRYRATRVRHWSDSNYNYTETRHYSLHRAGGLSFDAVPVDGSGKMPNDLMESIEPYDLTEAVDFESAYLAGFLADKYDIGAEESRSRANERIKQSVQEEFARTAQGYSSVTAENVSVRLKNGSVKYALLPVWLLSTQYQGQNYTFAMNGQTGKFVGDLPMDKGAYWMWWGIVVLLSAALSFGITYLMM